MPAPLIAAVARVTEKVVEVAAKATLESAKAAERACLSVTRNASLTPAMQRGLMAEGVGLPKNETALLMRVGAIRPEIAAEAITQTRRQVFEEFLASRKSPEARFDACVKYALEGPYLGSKPDGFGYKIAKLARPLREVDGIERTLRTIGHEGLNKAKGDCHTLCRAAHWQASGHEVAALNKPIRLPINGKTDIDILFRDGTWIEAKRVGPLSAPRGIACDEKFREQISKMEEAVKSGLQVNIDGEPITIKRALYMNRGAITSEAIEYARDRGVEVYAKQPFTRVISHIA
jgi:hypothetical protein